MWNDVEFITGVEFIQIRSLMELQIKEFNLDLVFTLVGSVDSRKKDTGVNR